MCTMSDGFPQISNLSVPRPTAATIVVEMGHHCGLSLPCHAFLFSTNLFPPKL